MTLNRLLMLLAAGLVLFGTGSAAFAIREEMVEENLIAKVQQGGYVLYLRHAQRYKGPPDKLTPTSPQSAFADCTHQRNLTPYGMGQAALLGENLRRLGVKVDIVLANPSCRTRDTAMLAFGRATLEARMFEADYIRRRLAIAPAPGANNALIGGESPLRQIVGFQIDPAEIAVFRPDDNGGATLIGRLKAEDWFDD